MIAVESVTGHLRLPGIERTHRVAHFTPQPRVDLAQWSDDYRRLSSDASPIAGKWRSFPFQREIMVVLGSGEYRLVVAMLPSQVCGKTEIPLNLVLQRIHMAPCPMLIVLPTLDMARTLSKKRIDTAFRDMDVLKGKLIDHGARKEKDDTILHKAGTGWSLRLVGANSPSGLAMDSICVLVLDEVDRYPASAGKEGDVISIAKKRTTAFPNRIIYESSTPTDEESRIAKDYELSDQRKWLVPCPHCGHKQSLEWGGPESDYGLKWEKDEEGRPIKESVQYLCIDCHALIDEKYKHQMNEAGQWVAQRPGRDIAGFQCTALVSPILHWWEIVIEWHEAQGDQQQIKSFVNTRLCRTYTPPGAKADVTGLKGRRATFLEDGAGFPVVPMDAGIVVMAVDVQAGGEFGGSRLEAHVAAFGAGKQEWKLGIWRFNRDKRNPKQAWEDVERLRTRGWAHESGATLYVRRCAVDVGNETAEVADYVRPLERNGVLAVIGARELTAQMISKPGKRSKGHKLLIWQLGLTALKDEIFNSLARVTTPGPGYIHFSHQIDDAFIEQLAAERRVFVRKGTQSFATYERIGDKPNEGTDLSVYVRGAFYSEGPAVVKQMAGMVKAVQERGAVEKAAAEKAKGEPAPDQPEPEEPSPRPRAAPRRSGFVNAWKAR